MSNPPPRDVVFKNFSSIQRELDLAIGEIQSTFNMWDAIFKKSNKSTIDEKIIAGILGGSQSAAAFFNKIALGAFTGPITAAVTSVVTAVGGLLLLSNPARRGLLSKSKDWNDLMKSDIEIFYDKKSAKVNLKNFCLDPEGEFKKAFSIKNMDAFNRAQKTIPETSRDKIIMAGELSKHMDTSIKILLAAGGLGIGAYFAKTTAVPISMGYSPDSAKNRSDNRQQIIRPNVEDLTGLAKPIIKPKK